VWRIEFNQAKVDFILENTAITLPIIQKAMRLCRSNPYHNFGHTLGMTVDAIRIMQAIQSDSTTITLVALACLFHDAKHTGISLFADEILAVQFANRTLSDHDLIVCGLSSSVRTRIRDLILATIFTTRGKWSDPLAMIIQDADLAHLGKGPYMWMYASMGMIDEFAKEGNHLDPVNFIRKMQPGFLNFVKSMNPDKKFFLSSGAQSIFIAPEQSLNEILCWPDRVYHLAYDLCQLNIHYDRFVELLQRQI
jgi:predicted metal-dependent HD superfamily phosphohydrolase